MDEGMLPVIIFSAVFDCITSRMFVCQNRGLLLFCETHKLVVLASEALYISYLRVVLLRLNEKNISATTISQVIDCLKNGGIIIYPTDTVYALGCDITNPKAVEKLCKLKGIKPEKSHFSFVCSDLSHLSEFTRAIPNHVFRVMKKALPGPYTFILEANGNVPKLLKQNKKTVGIRVPANLICKEIVEALGNPLISTSLVDTSDDIVEYFADPDLIYRQYEGKVDMVIDGGFGNIYPSTVIDCSGDTIEVLREGLGSLQVLY
jgi:tRNA threonylcarbamoyl adenosine modification protein (Sua5/YciO/YrdC/YwlC family)